MFCGSQGGESKKLSNMKISYVVNARIPTEKAHGLNVMTMCKNFSELGHEVELVVPQRKNSIQNDPFDFYDVPKNFTIKFLPSLDLFNFEKQIGKVAFFIQFFTFFFSAFLKILFSERKVIYTRNHQFAYLSFFGKKVFFECHSLPRKTRLFVFLCKRMKGVVVVTKQIKKKMIELGISESKIMIAPDAVDLKIFDIKVSQEEAQKKLNLPRDKKLLIYTGKFKTMNMDKGISDILKALAGLDDSFVFLAVGGSKDDVSFYINKAKQSGVEKKCIFLGHKKQKELAIYQKAADVLLMPFPGNEHFAFYMSPIKMFEYMASKRPIIASDLPSIRDVLNEQNSFLCLPDKSKDLAEKIEFVIKQESVAKEKFQNAYSAVKEYTWQKRAKRIINFIKKYL